MRGVSFYEEQSRESVNSRGFLGGFFFRGFEKAVLERVNRNFFFFDSHRVSRGFHFFGFSKILHNI